jgi:excisionase family DNA binding protein
MSDLVDYEGAREALGGVSWMTVHRLKKSGELPAVLIGTRVLFRRTDLNALIDRKTVSRSAVNRELASGSPRK